MQLNVDPGLNKEMVHVEKNTGTLVARQVDEQDDAHETVHNTTSVMRRMCKSVGTSVDSLEIQTSSASQTETMMGNETALHLVESSEQVISKQTRHIEDLERELARLKATNSQLETEKLNLEESLRNCDIARKADAATSAAMLESNSRVISRLIAEKRRPEQHELPPTPTS